VDWALDPVIAVPILIRGNWTSSCRRSQGLHGERCKLGSLQGPVQTLLFVLARISALQGVGQYDGVGAGRLCLASPAFHSVLAD